MKRAGQFSIALYEIHTICEWAAPPCPSVAIWMTQFPVILQTTSLNILILAPVLFQHLLNEISINPKQCQYFFLTLPYKGDMSQKESWKRNIFELNIQMYNFPLMQEKILQIGCYFNVYYLDWT